MPMKERYARGLRWLLVCVLALGVAVWFAAAVRQVQTGQREQGRRQLELSLRRGAVACYADRGAYPQTLDELTQRTGISIDERYYRVFYQVFADNLMPDITVLEAEI